jgi:fatty acid synthase subunit alpha, fungi type
MRPEVEQELAHTLLVELLAYQFASPVRWIETQDVILAEKTTERIVEIGPADTLGVMAKRTLASKYEAYDAAKSVQRQILCYNKDAKEIYYDVDPVEDEPTPAAGPSDSAPAPAASSSNSAPAAAAAPPPPSAGPAAQVPDAPVGAVDIVRTLIAQKLKKPLLEIPLSKAIKDLVGGKYKPFGFSIHRLRANFSALQANPLSKTKSSVIWARNLAQPPRNQKILL